MIIFSGNIIDSFIWNKARYRPSEFHFWFIKNLLNFFCVHWLSEKKMFFTKFWLMFFFTPDPEHAS